MRIDQKRLQAYLLNRLPNDPRTRLRLRSQFAVLDQYSLWANHGRYPFREQRDDPWSGLMTLNKVLGPANQDSFACMVSLTSDGKERPGHAISLRAIIEGGTPDANGVYPCSGAVFQDLRKCLGEESLCDLVECLGTTLWLPFRDAVVLPDLVYDTIHLAMIYSTGYLLAGGERIEAFRAFHLLFGETPNSVPLYTTDPTHANWVFYRYPINA